MENFKETFYLISQRINNINYVIERVQLDEQQINEMTIERDNLIKQQNLLRTFIIDHKYKK